MSKKIRETVKIDQAIASVDINTNKTSPWYSMAEYRRVLAFIGTDTVAQTKSVTIQLLQAKDATGTGSKALSDVVTKTAPTGGAKLTLDVETTVSKLDKGFTHVAVKLTSDAGATLLASAVLIRGDGRYGNKRP